MSSRVSFSLRSLVVYLISRLDFTRKPKEIQKKLKCNSMYHSLESDTCLVAVPEFSNGCRYLRRDAEMKMFFSRILIADDFERLFDRKLFN